MKKVLIIVLLCVGVSVFGLDHGLISGFEVGWNMNSGIILNNDLVELADIRDNSLYLQLKTGYRIENLRIVGTYTNTMYQVELDKYQPIQDNFRIDLNYTWNNITIGVFYWCDHTVLTQVDQREVFSNSSQRALYVKFYKEF